MNSFSKKIVPLLLTIIISFTSTILFVFPPVVANATVESIAFSKCMEYLFGLWGIGTKQSFDAFNGYKGYSDSEKASAIQGVQDWFDDCTRDWRNWAVVHRGIAKAKVDEWENSVREGWLDFSSDVGSAFKDWASALSKNVSDLWNGDYPTKGGLETPEAITYEYMTSLARTLAKPSGSSYLSTDPIKDMDRFCQGTVAVCVLGYTKLDNGITAPNFAAISYNADTDEYYFSGKSLWAIPYYQHWKSWYTTSEAINPTKDSVILANDKIKNKIKDKITDFPGTYEDSVGGEKQLPAVVDEFGSHLPVPQNNEDPEQKPDKKYPPTVTPVYIPWKQLEPSPQPVGVPTVIIDPTVINWQKETNVTIEEIRAQLQQISIALSKVMNVVLINELTNMSIDGKTKGKTKPDFNMDIDLRKKFPFCIPWDIYAIVGFLNADPLAPCFDLPMPIKGSDGVVKHTVRVDFGTTDIDGDGQKDLDLNTVSKVCRVLFFILFVVGFSYIFFFKG